MNLKGIHWDSVTGVLIVPNATMLIKYVLRNKCGLLYEYLTLKRYRYLTVNEIVYYEIIL